MGNNENVSTTILAPLHERIMGELKKQSKAPHEYINPHFLAQITDALGEYYNVEDEGVDKWVKVMWSA